MGSASVFSFFFSKSFWFKLFVGFSLLLIFGISMYWFISIHEQVHVNVAERNGCSVDGIQVLPDTDQSFGEFSVALAGANYSCPSHSVFEKVKAQHQTVDTVGYQLFPVYMILVLVLLLQIVKVGYS